MSTDGTDRLARQEARAAIGRMLDALRELGAGSRLGMRLIRARIERRMKLQADWRLSRLGAVACVSILVALRTTSADELLDGDPSKGQNPIR